MSAPPSVFFITFAASYSEPSLLHRQSHRYRADSSRITRSMSQYTFLHPEDALLQKFPSPIVIPNQVDQITSDIQTDFNFVPILHKNRTIHRTIYTLSRRLRDLHRHRIKWQSQIESSVVYLVMMGL